MTSQTTLVLTREEERCRIRRDLHDEPGPTLAGQTLAFDAILALGDDQRRSARPDAQLRRSPASRRYAPHAFHFR
ncbi:MAG: hypothetical protein KDE29_10675 [Anaerolineales bacterium]|nr:hypothetical protein [Anaerolineales bacterium]